MLALFERYPRLPDKLPHVPLGDFPTPIERLDRLGAVIRAPRLYVKRDDLSGRPYGGNKVRALEFLLGEAQHARAGHVFALGFPASCQALAQAIYAPRAGLRSTAFLFPQINSQQARQHLALYQGLGANVRPITALFPFLARHFLTHGKLPLLLEASTPEGAVGYVNAGFELKRQIEQGQLPEPDLIYLALATNGTLAGLQLGLRAAGLNSQVIGVSNGGRVLGRPVATPARLAVLARQTVARLRAADPGFPGLVFAESDFTIRAGYECGATTLLTPAGAEALRQARDLAGLTLDEMFTANAFAALLADGAAGQFQGQTVLWWNTYNSHDFSAQLAAADYRRLPRAFHRHFETEPAAV